jgi:hypothetical protein
MTVQRAVCNNCNIALEGEIEVSALARLSLEDQIFVAAFVRSHGSIKRMEALFDISYPTVKNRLDSITASLDEAFTPPDDGRSEILDRLSRGEISIEQALEAFE